MSTRPTHAPDPVAVVRQHARTSQLLGVDFVPVYRRAGSEAEARGAPQAVEVEVEAKPVRTPTTEAGARPSPLASGRDAHAVRAALDAIRARYEADAPHQHFTTDHHTIVWDDGDPASRLMFIGEAPGADEDRIGRPFVGKAGQLLDRMITAMGLMREEVYITNVLKTRPPGNATPTTDEVALCAPYLFDQIAAVRPEVIVTLGLTASRAVLRNEATMGSMRGVWTEFKHPDEFSHPGLCVPVMPTFHPAFLLRQYTEENRKKVWSDLQEAMKRLGLAPKRG